MIASFLKRNAYRFGAVNPDPILIFGNQKSGTTAIGSLVAEAAGISSTQDFFYRVPGFERTFLSQGSDFQKVINRFRYHFSKDLIKEPGMTPHFEQIQELYDFPRSIFIVRDPRENIRSILNRLSIDGKDEGRVPLNWQERSKEYFDEWSLILEGEPFGYRGNTFIERLAARCQHALLLAQMADRLDNVLVVKYESFVENKMKIIDSILDALNLEKVNDVTGRLNVQFQHKGKSVKPIEFFSSKNLSIINNACREGMSYHGY